jgi:hypothetical protein
MNEGDDETRRVAEDVRIPVVKDLPDDIFHMLHHSHVDIVRMRRRIESADLHVIASAKACAESRELLDSMRFGLRSHSMELRIRRLR